MGVVNLPSFGSDPATVNAANLDGKVDPLATEFNGGIDNDNIASDAAIANSKLNLASISQNIAHSGTMTHSGVVTMSSKIIKLAKGADVASANALTLGTDGNYFDITGTTAITSIGTLGVGTVVRLHFDGALTFTHHATDLIIPGGANITTAAGDECELIEYASGDWRVVSYVKASGLSIISDAPSAAAQSDQETATSTTTYVSPGRQQFHPSAAKAWFVLDGQDGSPAMDTSYNCDSSITDGGTGDYTISFTTDFSGAHYAAAGFGQDTENNGIIVSGKSNTAPGAGSIQILVTDSGASAADVDWVSMVFFGDHA